MKRILLFLALIASVSASAQFPNTDSLQRYINRWIRNSAVDAFTNLRLNTALNGLLKEVKNIEVTNSGIQKVIIDDDSLKIITTANDTFAVLYPTSNSGVTNISISRTSGQVNVQSSTGTTGIIPPASQFFAGIMTAADKILVDSAVQRSLLRDSVNTRLHDIYRRGDSVFYVKSGAEVFAFLADASVGSGTVTNVADGYGISGGPITTAGTLSLDTAQIGSWFLRRGDSVGLYTSRYRLDTANTNLRTLIYGKLSNITGLVSAGTGVSLAGSGVAGDPYVISSAISGGTVTSVGSGYGLSGGPITGAGTLVVDTATLAGRFLRRGDTALIFTDYRNAINSRIRYADTTAIFASYLTAINNRVKYSDTAAMLDAYENALNTKQGLLTLTTTGSGGATLIGNTLNIPIPAGSVYTAGVRLTLTGNQFNVDTLALLAPYQTAINARVKYSDTSSMLTAYRNSLNTKLQNITGHITAGSNVTVTGAGTLANPYVIASSGGSGGAYIFTPADFNESGSTVSIDYTNGQAASAATKGFLNAADWNTFNNKQNAIALGTTSQYFRGDLSLATFPTAVSSFTNDAGYLTNITGKVSAGTNVSITGLGTTASPYVINSTATGLTNGDKGDITVIDPTNWNIDALAVGNAEINDVAWTKITGIPSDIVYTGATQTLTNKTLTSPVINVGTDATGDVYYRSAGGAFTRLPIGSTGQVIKVVGGVPAWAADATSGGGGATLSDGDYGSVTVSGTGTAITIDAQAVSNSMLANMATLTIKGNNTGGTAAPQDLTVAQVNAMLPVFTSTLKGLVPASGGTPGLFLQADGTWAAPASGYTFEPNDFNGTTNISIDYSNGQKATGSTNGFLTSGDWTTLMAKQNAITLGTTAQYFRGDLSLATFPTNVSTFTNDANYLTNITGKITAGTNVSITGSGTTASPYVVNATASGSGTVNTGIANRLAYYAASGTIVDDLAAITANRALVSDANGLPTASTVTNTELGYVAGVTSGIQAQIDTKQPIINVTTTGTSGPATLVGATLNIPQYAGGGSGITALTGDVTASGTGSVAATLATVNSNVGSFNFANITVNAKGLITAASSGTIDASVTDGSTNPVQGNAVFDALALKQNNISLTTAGSGAATFIGNVLNIPTASSATNGLPPGGTAGQILSKINSTDYNAQWIPAPSLNYFAGYGVSIDGENNVSIDTASLSSKYLLRGAITAGTNITITGTGTGASPYVVSSTGGGITDGDKSEITVSGSGATWVVDNGLPATKLADGSVSNAELQYINTVTSNVQTQLDAKFSTAGYGMLASGVTPRVDTVELEKRYGKKFPVELYGTVDLSDNTGVNDGLAIQAAINAAYAAGGGTVWLRNGIYNITNSIITNFGGRPVNSQIVIPYSPQDNAVVIKIEGETPNNWEFQGVGGAEPSNGGVLIKSSLTSTSAGQFVIAAVKGPGDDTFTKTNQTDVWLQNISVRIRRDAGAIPLGGINFRYMSKTKMDFVKVDIDVSLDESPDPTGTGSVGIYLPEKSNHASLDIGTIRVGGFDIGMILGEHAVIKDYQNAANNVGMVVPNGDHSASIQTFEGELNKTNIRYDGDMQVNIWNFNSEHYTTVFTPRWFNFVSDVTWTAYTPYAPQPTKLVIGSSNVGVSGIAGESIVFVTNDESRVIILARPLAGGGGAGSLQAVTAVGNETSDLIQVTGIGKIPTSGAGVHMYYQETFGRLQSYDFTSAAYTHLELIGSDVALVASTSQKLKASSSGITLSGVPTGDSDDSVLVVENGLIHMVSRGSIGGGGGGDLQAVTDVGNTTTNSIFSTNTIDAPVGFFATNNSTGTSANAYLAAGTASGAVVLQAYGSGHALTNSASIFSQAGLTGGMKFFTQANAPMTFLVNSTGETNPLLTLSMSGIKLSSLTSGSGSDSVLVVSGGIVKRIAQSSLGGGGGGGSLQATTDIGNTTTNSIAVTGSGNYSTASEGLFMSYRTSDEYSLLFSYDWPNATYKNMALQAAEIQFSNPTANNGYRMMPFTGDGTYMALYPASSLTTPGGTNYILATKGDNSATFLNGTIVGLAAGGVQQLGVSGSGVSVSSLAGSGTRMVVASATGELSTQTIPGGGGFTSPLTTTGDLLSYSGGTHVRIAAGTSGYYLGSNGAGALPSWKPMPANPGGVDVQQFTAGNTGAASGNFAGSMAVYDGEQGHFVVHLAIATSDGSTSYSRETRVPFKRLSGTLTLGTEHEVWVGGMGAFPHNSLYSLVNVSGNLGMTYNTNGGNLAWTAVVYKYVSSYGL